MAEHACVLSIVLVMSMDCFYGVFFLISYVEGKKVKCVWNDMRVWYQFFYWMYNRSFLHLFFVVSVSSVFRQAVNSACDSDCA